MFKRKYIVSFDVHKLSKEDLLNFCTEKSITDSEKVLSYLKNRHHAGCGSNSFIDKIKDMVVEESDNVYTDGEYVWYTPEVYYFEKYNLKLNDDFIEHVLSKS